jgi:hypothetical protein
MRPDSILHGIPVHLWTPDEVQLHLERTFRTAVDQRPDLLEPYLIRLEGEDEASGRAIMREALAATFAGRYPGRLRHEVTL